MSALLLLNFFIPFVMILVSSILKKHPVSDMDSHNGYNTPASRKSQARWDYAQSIAPDIYISLGKILFALEITASIILFILKVSVIISNIAGMCAGLAFLFLGFYKTDKKIEEKFAHK